MKFPFDESKLEERSEIAACLLKQGTSFFLENNIPLDSHRVSSLSRGSFPRVCTSKTFRNSTFGNFPSCSNSSNIEWFSLFISPPRVNSLIRQRGIDALHLSFFLFLFQWIFLARGMRSSIRPWKKGGKKNHFHGFPRVRFSFSPFFFSPFINNVVRVFLFTGVADPLTALLSFHELSYELCYTVINARQCECSF